MNYCSNSIRYSKKPSKERIENTMGRCGCCLIILLFIVIIVVDALLFAYFIGRYDPQEKKLSTGDMVQIDQRLSNFWCKGVTLTSSLSFDAFQLDSAPLISDGYAEDSNYDFDLSLSRHEYRLYKFYLLENSNLKVSICSSEPVVMVSIFQNDDDVTKCLAQRAALDSDEDDYDDLQCHNTVLSSKVTVESDCESDRFVWWQQRRKGMDVANIRTYSNGYYYVLVQNFYYSGQNRVKLEMNISRAVYVVKDSDQTCINTKACYLGLRFWSEDTVVAHMRPSQTKQKLIDTSIFYECNLNIIVLICVFLVLPFLLFLLFCCSYCCCCRKKTVKHEIYYKNDDKKAKEALLHSMDYKSEDNSVFMSDADTRNYGATSAANNFSFPPQNMNNPPQPQPYNTTTASAPTAYYPYPPPPQPPSYENVPPPATNPNIPGYPSNVPAGPAPPYSYKPT